MSRSMTPRDTLPSVLLLPVPPDPPSRELLSACYRPSLKAAVCKVRDPAQPAILVVAVVGPWLRRSFQTADSSLSWSQAQWLLARLYSLVAVICAEEPSPISSDVGGGPGSVDVRFILLHETHLASDGPRPRYSSTSILDLAMFVSTYQPWNHILYVDGEAGYELRSSFLRLAEGYQTILQDQLVPVQGGISLHSDRMTPRAPASVSCSSEELAAASYSTVCLGGTFDHLHLGHKLLLSAAVLLLNIPEQGEVSGSSRYCRLIIGITGAALLENKKYVEYVQSWNDRASAVLDMVTTLLESPSTGGHNAGFLESRQRSEAKVDNGFVESEFRQGTVRVQCVEILDAFGPTITDESVECLVVSGETRSGGQAVNDRRQHMGWKKLAIHEVDVLDDQDRQQALGAGEMVNNPKELLDFSSKISSTTIRQRIAEAAAATTLRASSIDGS